MIDDLEIVAGADGQGTARRIDRGKEVVVMPLAPPQARPGAVERQSRQEHDVDVRAGDRGGQERRLVQAIGAERKIGDLRRGVESHPVLAEGGKAAHDSGPGELGEARDEVGLPAVGHVQRHDRPGAGRSDGGAARQEGIDDPAAGLHPLAGRDGRTQRAHLPAQLPFLLLNRLDHDHACNFHCPSRPNLWAKGGRSQDRAAS